jgi:hypothetical protein
MKKNFEALWRAEEGKDDLHFLWCNGFSGRADELAQAAVAADESGDLLPAATEVVVGEIGDGKSLLGMRHNDIVVE